MRFLLVTSQLIVPFTKKFRIHLKKIVNGMMNPKIPEFLTVFFLEFFFTILPFSFPEELLSLGPSGPSKIGSTPPGAREPPLRLVICGPFGLAVFGISSSMEVMKYAHGC